MSELEDLVGIYGAIDRAVQRRPDLLTTVGNFFDPYRDPNAVGWFDEFETWTVERFGESRIPDLDAAVVSLARTPTSGRMAARRILVIGVAARLGHGLISPDATTDLAAALSVEGIAGPGGHDSALELLSLLVDDSVFANLGNWSQLILTAVERELVAASLAVQAVAAPCDCELVVVPQPGSPFPAVELHTSFTTNAITIDQAKRFLDPTVWPQCGQWWCEMRYVSTTPPPNNSKIYHEIFSLDCNAPNAAWTVEAYLEFKQFNIGAGARVSYRLSPSYANPDVSVDEGWFTVLPDPGGGPGVKVDTVKRVRFNHPFGGQSLAMVMCALGYGGAAEQLVLSCAVQNANNPGAGVPFQGVPQPAGTTPTNQAPGPHAANGPGVDAVLSDAVDQLKQCVDNCASAYTNAYTKMSSPDYSVNDAAALMVDMWSRYMREAAGVAALMLRSAKAAGTTATKNSGQAPGGSS
jgi:hypothetical protein